MRLTLPLLLGLLCVGPVGAACSLAGPVPGPGHLYIYDVKTQEETDVPVRQRYLGGGCELSNPFAYNGKHFVWVEGEERAGASQTMRIQTASGTVRTLQAAGQRHLALGLTASHLYHLSSETTGSFALYKQSLSDQQETRISASVPGHALLNAATVAWTSNDGKRFNVLDAQENRWILRDATLDQLGVQAHDQAQLLAASDEWLVFSSYLSTQAPTVFRFWIYDVAARKSSDASQALADADGFWIDQRTIYTAPYDSQHKTRRLVGYDAKTLEQTDQGPLPHELGQRLLVKESRVILASYRDQDPHTHANGHQSHAPPPEAPTWSIPGPGLAIAVAALTIALRRRH